MTEQAPKDVATFPPALLNSALMRARQNHVVHGGEKVVSLGLPMVDQNQGVPEPRNNVSRDWGSALDLVREASEAIRISDERANQLEEQLAQVLNEVGEEIKNLTAQIAGGEQRLAQAEQRAVLAEARAAEAEAWLARFHDAVVSAFTPVLKDGAPKVPDEDKVATALPA